MNTQNNFTWFSRYFQYFMYVLQNHLYGTEITCTPGQYCVDKKYTLEKHAHYTSVLMLHYNSGNISSIQNMENSKTKNCTISSVCCIQLMRFSNLGNGAKYI